MSRSMFRSIVLRGLWISLLLTLVACASSSGQRRVISAPLLSVQEIELLDGRWIARVRLDSPSTIPMDLERLDWRLTLGIGPTESGSAALGVTLPAKAGDTLRIDLGGESSLLQLTSLGARDSLAYRLEGELHTSSPKSRFPLRYDGQLRPTPGKPGSFR